MQVVGLVITILCIMSGFLGTFSVLALSVWALMLLPQERKDGQFRDASYHHLQGSFSFDWLWFWALRLSLQSDSVL